MYMLYCSIHVLHLTPSPPDMNQGAVGQMDKLGVTESYRVKLQMLVSAAEAAEMILRVDDIIKAAPRYAYTVHMHVIQALIWTVLVQK